MRTHHWLTAFLVGIVLFAGHWKAEAQFPPNAPGRATFSPVEAQFFQPGFNPYPTISPFDNVFQETYNQNGLWFSNSSNNTQNGLYGGIDFILANFSDFSDDKVGTEASHGAMYFDTGEFSILNGVPPLGRTPFASFNADLFDGRGPYPAANTGTMQGPKSAGGLRIYLGVDSPDGTSFEANGFGIFPSSSSKQYGNPIVRVGPRGRTADVTVIQSEYINGRGRYNPDTTGISPGPNNSVATDVVDGDQIGAHIPGIPIIDGSALGAVVRTDHYLRLDHRAEMYGAGFTAITSPINNFFGFEVRPLFGVQYLRPSEVFAVEGHDSGLDYEVDVTPGVGDDENGEGFILPDSDITIIRVPYRVYIDSSTETNMAGPELGWKYSAGGDSFRLTGQTKIGVMVAREKTKLRTRGLGQAYLINDDGVDTTLPLTTFGGFNPFYDPDAITITSEESSYITPTFEQSFTTSSHLLSYIPLIRRASIFRNAKFSAGWTIRVIGQMQRPNEAIVYQSGNGINDGSLAPIVPDPIPTQTIDGVSTDGDPTLVPQIKKDRSVFFVNYWNLGVEWIY